MKRWMIRIRAAVRMGLAWALAWFGAGMVLLLGSMLLTGTTGADVPYPLGFGMFGFFAGAAFSGVLGLAEGRRRFDQMSLPRFAGWGAAGGIVLSAGFSLVAALFGDTTPLRNLWVVVPAFMFAGAGSGAGVLALARKAEERGGLRDGDEIAEAELSGKKRQDLLRG